MHTPPRRSLSVSGDIPFNKLVLSGSNVRRTKAHAAIEQLADDIARSPRPSMLRLLLC